MNAPTLLSSCAKATTAAEARFRVDYPNSKARASRIIALDEDAADLMHRVEDDSWGAAHFLSFHSRHPAPGIEALSIDATLTTPDGNQTRLSSELAGADVVVMIASSGHEILSPPGTVGFVSPTTALSCLRTASNSWSRPPPVSASARISISTSMGKGHKSPPFER